MLYIILFTLTEPIGYISNLCNCTVTYLFLTRSKKKTKKQKNFEGTKGVIRSRKSKGRQFNDQKKKDRWTNNVLQNTTHKTNDRSSNTNSTTKGSEVV
jgi:hypothetical protein